MGMKLSIGAGTIILLALVASGAVAKDYEKVTVQERPITLVGCVIRESDYRSMLGVGGGSHNDFVLVNASESQPGRVIPGETAANCWEGRVASGSAYELKGRMRRNFEPFVGRMVEVSGKLDDDAKVFVASGQPAPQLFEVKVAALRAPIEQVTETTTTTNTTTTVTPPETATAAAVIVTPAPAQEMPRVTERAVGTAGMERRREVRREARARLPRTATPVPMAELFGLFSLVAGLGLRFASRRS